MKTLLIGTGNEPLRLIQKALEVRGHDVEIRRPEEIDIDVVSDADYPFIVFSNYTPETIPLCRQIRGNDRSDVLMLIAALDQSSIDQFHALLDAGIDQCIVESLFDEKRLDVRLAFAEKLSQNKLHRREMENKLRESEARYRSIVETTVDAIITINEKADVLTFNRAAEKLFLYRPDEVIGQNVKMLMPDPYKNEHDDYINNYITTGRRKIIGIGREVSGQRKDGTTFPMYLAVSEFKLLDGERIFTGIVRDISDQRRLEQEILHTSEHERRRIGQDLHDGLGQMLTGIGLISKNLSDRLSKADDPLSEQAEEITTLIREADQYARELARGLVPVELEAGGLVAALERLTTQAKKLFSIQCTFTSRGAIHFEDPSVVTHVYRIAQESVSNAVKHGQSTRVHIELTGAKSHTRLMIEDNGSGFSEDWNKKNGLGVRIMQFRAKLISAQLEITDASPGGARIICRIPQTAQSGIGK